MPILAFVMAIGLAFATETTDNSQTGYYEDPITGVVKPIDVDCDSSSEQFCMFNKQQVFAEPELLNELKKTKEQ